MAELSKSGGSKPSLVGRSGDGKREKYRYRAYEFTIERTWLMWWCHSGVSIPTDPTDPFWRDWPGAAPEFELHDWDHEAGWASLSRRSILRKLRRVVDRDIREKVREREVDNGPAFMGVKA